MSSRQTVLLKDKVLPSQGTKQTSYHMQSLLMHKQQGKTCITQTPNFSGTSMLSQKLFLQSFLAKTLGHTKTWSSETSDFHKGCIRDTSTHTFVFFGSCSSTPRERHLEPWISFSIRDPEIKSDPEGLTKSIAAHLCDRMGDSRNPLPQKGMLARFLAGVSPQGSNCCIP